jgi:uncharacterized protein (TIGR00369 family)
VAAPIIEIDTDKATHVLGVFSRAAFVVALGVTVTRLAEGVSEVELDVRPDHLQQNGFVHAGVLATLADHNAGGCAATAAPVGTEVLSIEFKLNLLRAAKGPKLWCQSRALRVGRTIAVVESEVWDVGAERTLVAKATVTLALR